MYGQPPYNVAVIHGGPGAAGEMAPVAVELSKGNGILEPLQTADYIDGQVEELLQLLQSLGSPPMILVGFSWGAWLSCIFASRYPHMVKKLILVSSGPFQATFAESIMETRYQRLTEDEQRTLQYLMQRITEPDEINKDAIMSQIGNLITQADSYSALSVENEVDVRVSYEIFSKVWKEASALRRKGDLLSHVEKIKCPVVAIHGDYDPHPYEGVEAPLSSLLNDFRFILLPKCGHRPWMEAYARDSFFDALAQVVNE